MSAPIRKITQSVETMTRRAEKGLSKIQRQTSRLSNNMTGLAKTGAATGTALVFGLGSALRAGVEFEHTMNRATAKMGDNVGRGTEAYNKLIQAAQKVGETTQFSATQAAQGIEFLAMAGFNAEQSVAALPGVVNLAIASNTDLARATDLASDALGAFGLMTKDTTQLTINLNRVNDVLAKTSSSANTSVEQMFEAMKKGGPIATKAGQSIETVAAMLGVMANSGIKAEIAGTAVQNFFLRLAAPAGEAGKILKRLGINVADSTGKMRDAFDIVGDLNKALSGMGEQQRLSVIQKVFGAEGLAGNLAVLTAGKEGMNQYRDSLENATGAAQKMATTIQDDTMGSFRSMLSVIESVSIKTFSLAQGPIRDLIDQTTNWIRTNGELMAQNFAAFLIKIIDNIDEIVAALKTFGTVVAVLWAAEKAVTILTGAITLGKYAVIAFNAALALNPMFWIPAAIVAVGALAAAIYTHWEPIKAFFTDLWGGVTGVFDRAMTAIKTKFTSFITPIKNAIGDVLQSIDSVLGGGGQANTVVTAGSGFTAGHVGGVGRGGGTVVGHVGGVGRGGGTVVGPQERAQMITQQNTDRQITEVVIRDETGRAEMKENGPRKSGVTLDRTGEF